MALAELPALAYSVRPSGIDVNVYGPSVAALPLPDGGTVRLTQETSYPFDGSVRLSVDGSGPFTLRLRIPSWAMGATLQLNGAPLDITLNPGEFAALARDWQPGDTLRLSLPMAITVQRRQQQNTQESRAPDGSPVAQQVLCFDYLALTRGPLVYATELIDGFKTEETILPPDSAPAQWLTLAEPQADEEGAAIEMRLGYRPPLRFTPFYRTGGRQDGAWRLTWLSLAP